ncbi:class I SAM-dependent methyltransferase [Rhodopirellula sp. MGV]|uniref:class I SAM-dependent methyltransferase n=1 Tax=Rhodopirellula sp. MGV TaxID=2023130 RepID=UPI000B966473|nr:class I SAM-dependent methyltransferase [Rhodopirellula sp. MGV]OYP28441.1 hypothetical protein CGZ80_26935 [Rhodopirellula sp. MGV]PNY38683.1 class I SAM-dependent methyltransferase [Rhodopirellula baltica]
MSDQPTDQQQAQSVRGAGDRTVQQYQEWMQINGAAHLMRAARESGVTAALRDRQHSLEELCEALSLQPATTRLLLGGLVAIGYVEQYGDDYALARAGHLLCQYDEDLGDARYGTLVARLKGETVESLSADSYRDDIAATQWIHTSAAMQAAEVLDVGGESYQGTRVLDLGCGSAVWSCAMAHRDETATVLAVDHPGAVEAARATAQSINLQDRYEFLPADPRQVDLGEREFDLVVLAQVLSAYSDDEAAALVKQSASVLASGGRLAVPDLYIGPGKAGLKESLGRLTTNLATPAGRVRELRDCQQMLLAAGLGAIQFTYLAASPTGLGMMVAEKA